jgi:hypothetical protein
MPTASRQSASERFAGEGFDAAYEHLEGGYTVGFEEYTADMDPAELFRGLPDDRCQFPHWGYVVRGKIVFRYADHEETFTAGQAYCAPPGHTPVVFADSEIVGFSPSDALAETFSVVTDNKRAAPIAG